MPVRRSFLRRLAAPTVLLVTILVAACVHVFVTPEATAVRPPGGERTDTSRSLLKVHLLDGSTVLFRPGARISAGRIEGDGTRYALLTSVGGPVGAVPMDSVAGVEALSDRTDATATVVVSVAATALLAGAAVLFAVAAFGSCPTVYADAGNGLVLQAEGFSYAISPLLEHRDLDPLRVRPDADGVIRLELRNEALETHFLNQVEIVAAHHAPGTEVVPDQGGRPVTVSGFSAVRRARDRAGRDVASMIAAHDGVLYSTAADVVTAAHEGDLDDWIDLEIDELPAGDSIAVVLRLRNSLLNTVFLYEGMLGGRDAPELLTQDLEKVAQTVDLARWYVKTLGMRATVEGVPFHAGEPFTGHARLPDVGPIAFRDVAIVLPRSAARDGHARVRLAFVADNWRIDEVRVAGTLSRPAVTTLAVARVVVPTPAVGNGPTVDAAALPALADADERYLETRPGQRMTLEFAPVVAHARDASSEVTYLIGWQGWYREWLRPSWLAAPTRTEPFVPGDAAMLTALRSWTSQKASFEKAFYSTSIPVR